MKETEGLAHDEIMDAIFGNDGATLPEQGKEKYYLLNVGKFFDKFGCYVLSGW